MICVFLAYLLDSLSFVLLVGGTDLNGVVCSYTDHTNILIKI